MAEFPYLFDPGQVATYDSDSQEKEFTVGTAHAKGAWTQWSASLGQELCGLVMRIRGDSSCSNSLHYLMDIGVGAAGSEQVIIPNILLHPTTDDVSAWPWFIPFKIPAGARLAVRGQSGAADNIGLFIAGVSKGFKQGESPQTAMSIGANTADSGGTQLDPGGVASTKGAYVELLASTTKDIRALLISVVKADPANVNGTRWAIDLAIGAAGSEVIILADYQARARQDRPQGPVFLPIKIPAGVRLAARCESNDITAGSRECDIALVGLA